MMKVGLLCLTVFSYRVAKFNGVTSLLAYFPTNYGAETTKIYYIGLRGDFTQVNYQSTTHDCILSLYSHAMTLTLIVHYVLSRTLNLVSVSLLRLQDPVL